MSTTLTVQVNSETGSAGIVPERVATPRLAPNDWRGIIAHRLPTWL